MKRVLLCLLLTGITGVLFAQRVIEKTYKTSKDQPVLLQFDFPKVKVSSWNKDEIYVKATVNINDNKQNDRFELLYQISGGKLVISDTIDFKHIDQQYYVEVGGVKKHFETKTDFENYKEAHPNEKFSSYTTNNLDIQIEVILPLKDHINVRSKFGLVEVQEYAGPLTVQTEFGKIDARLKESHVGKIKLTNQFGKIYSDFNLKPVEKEERSFYTSITANPGNGPIYELTSKFGNIYLRNTK
ncbi:hypothetical protein LQ567_18530 [Niabella pedocola]|uniref:Adhesin domain-containing protein n=1 Tax=Niabella pedocola TaxID=1752077 RepID=A0ABS8PUN6_9BACT|nr:hypothetical protein [Niabella pedocola]MCD2424785.1 hypothetical protein [Niabella pedocola]